MDYSVIIKKLGIPENELVFVGGSLIEGIGNKLSDIDIFVITSDIGKIKKENLEYEFEDVSFMFEKINGINCDVEIWTFEDFSRIVSQINKVDFMSTSNRIMNEIKGIDFSRACSLIHRMKHGQCVQNEIMFNEWINKINFEKYHMLKIRYYLANAEAKHDDIIGNLSNESNLTALFVAKEYLIYHAMSLLHAYGVSIDRKKWVFKKIQELSIQHSNIAILSGKIVENYFVANMDKPENSVMKILELCEEINNEIEERTEGV